MYESISHKMDEYKFLIRTVSEIGHERKTDWKIQHGQKKSTVTSQDK